MATLPQLELRCFGPPTALVDGKEPHREVVWHKHLALLIYLSLSPSRARTREHLRGLFWPEVGDGLARRSLNEAVRRLRKRLGAARLRSQGHLLEINDAGLVVDALDAKAVPAGDFLEGFNLDGCHAFEEWVSNERERIRSRAIGALLQAGEGKIAENRFVEAEAMARKALKLYILSEPATRLLMNALALSGNGAGALTVYHDFSLRLHEAIGEKPSRDLAALAERIRRGLDPSPKFRQDGDPKLVGHLDTYRRVFETAGEAPKQGARTILISGEPGVGRTRLLTECAERLATTVGAIAATARPLASDADARWSALRLLLRSGLAQAPGLVGASREALAILAAIAPGLTIQGKPVEPRDTGDVASALRDVLSAVAREHPLVIGIDDAQFADDGTLGALLGAMETLRTDPVVLVLTVPETQDRPSPELLRLRQEIGRRLPGLAVKLKPLPLQAIEELTQELAPWASEDTLKALSQRINHESGGVALFAVTLLRGIANANTLRTDLCMWPPQGYSTQRGSLPDRIGTAISARVVELGQKTREVLKAASIGGPAFDIDLIATITDLPRSAVEDALGAAERKHLVAFDGQRYVFPAAIVADVIKKQDLTPGMKRALRRRAAEALAQRSDLESQVLRAEMLVRVEGGPESFAVALAAAKQARNVGAEHATRRALGAAERAAGKNVTPEQKRQLDELAN